MQALIPMAGEGKRFKNAGYRDPKPFINVNGEPMIRGVIEDVKATFWPNRFIFLTRAEHEAYVTHMRRWLDVRPWFETVPSLTQGAACTALLARDKLNREDSLVVVNSDQRFTLPKASFDAQVSDADAAILVFESNESKWSYAVVNEADCVQAVVEKPLVPPSPFATVGAYWFKRAGTFLDAIDLMIARSDRVNGEFYIAPCFNHLFRGAKVKAIGVDAMAGLGTPEDLDAYLNRPSR